MVKNQGTKQRVQSIPGNCWRWETGGQCVTGDNCNFCATIQVSVEKLHHQIRLRILSCSRVSENHREPEVLEIKVRVVECRDGLARITLGELAITHFCIWHFPECLFYKNKSGCRFGKRCSFVHRQVDAQPTKWSKSNNDKSAVALLKKGD